MNIDTQRLWHDATMEPDAPIPAEPRARTDLRKRVPGWTWATIGGIATALSFVMMARTLYGGIGVVCGMLALVAANRCKPIDGVLGLVALVVVAVGGAQLVLGSRKVDSAGSSREQAVEPDHTPPTAVALPDPKTATCDTKDDCFALGKSRERAGDLAGALAAYTHGCELNGPSSCFNAGFMLHNLEPVKDIAKAAPFFQKSCDLHDWAACFNLGMDYLEGEGVAKDFARAVALFELSCTNRDANGCVDLGFAYLYHDPPAALADPAKGYRAFEKACGLGQETGCYRQYVALSKGTGVEKDLKRAVSHLTKMCDDEPALCGGIAYLMEHGEGVLKDPVKAQALFKRACDEGANESCKALH